MGCGGGETERQTAERDAGRDRREERRRRGEGGDNEEEADRPDEEVSGVDIKNRLPQRGSEEMRRCYRAPQRDRELLLTNVRPSLAQRQKDTEKSYSSNTAPPGRGGDERDREKESKRLEKGMRETESQGERQYEIGEGDERDGE